MLVREGQARTHEADRHLAWSLAGIAGALNAAGFYAVGLYASNMTGNVSALADHVGVGEVKLAALSLALVATFALGAMLCTLLVQVGRRRRLRGVYAYSISAEAVLLGALGVVDLWMPEVGRTPHLAFGLSFLLGLQNATVTQISNARVRTTHVTGMVTDIGIELANLIALDRAGTADEAARNREKLRLHGFTVASFLAGGVAGALAYRAVGGVLLLVAAALLVLLAAPAIGTARAGSARGTQPRP